MQELFLRVYRNTFKIVSDLPALLKNIERDFLYFKSPSKVSTPDFVITASIKKKRNIFPPKNLPWIKTREYTCYERNGEKRIFYRWGDIIILNYREKFAFVYSQNLMQLHETVYTLLLAVTGEYLEKQGYSRIHALGFSKNHKGGLVISAVGGGKTTLALELMNRGDFKIVSEDTPLLDKNLYLFPFPLRIGVREGTQLGMPSQYLRSFKRRKYGIKTLIDTDFFGDRIERSHVPLSLVCVTKLPKNRDEEYSVRRMNKLEFFYYLIKYLVVGRGVCQLEEIFFKKDFFDIYEKLKTLKNRFIISLRMAQKCKIYFISLSYDTEKNVELIDRLIRQA